MVVVLWRRSCMTELFVWRGSTRVLRRSFAGLEGIYIVCVAARQKKAGHAGSARVSRVPRTWYAALVAPRGSIPSESDVVVYDTALYTAWIHAAPAQKGSRRAWSLASCVTQPVHARPAQGFFAGSRAVYIVCVAASHQKRSAWVPRVSRGFHATLEPF